MSYCVTLASSERAPVAGSCIFSADMGVWLWRSTNTISHAVSTMLARSVSTEEQKRKLCHIGVLIGLSFIAIGRRWLSKGPHIQFNAVPHPIHMYAGMGASRSESRPHSAYLSILVGHPSTHREREMRGQGRQLSNF